MSGKRLTALREKVESTKLYTISDALELIKSCQTARFTESVEIAIKTGLNAKQVMLRGSCVLPHGTGKAKPRVAVFTKGDQIRAAEEAGATRVGLDDLAEEMVKNGCDYDVVIATPDAMSVVGKLGKILGPKGLMPSPKVGTVAPNAANAVANALKGQVMFKIEKAGIIHCMVGKSDFSVDALKENIEYLISEVKRLKPSSAKGMYLQKMWVSVTMGPSIKVELNSIDA